MRILFACLVLTAPTLAACGDDGGGDDGTGDLGPTCEVAADCDDGVFCNGAESCDEGRCAAGTAPCAASEVCMEEAGSCSSECPDADGDGQEDIACGGTDCDDTNDDVFVGNTEICDPDDVDEDCDPTTFGFRDQDMDGAPDAMCCNGANCGSDCDDLQASVGGSPIESCDGLDNDCDGSVDEMVLQTFYPDGDMDGYGDPDGTTMMACAPPVGYVANATDCNDAEGEINPAAFDQCDAAMVDDDCDGTPNNPAVGCTCENGTYDCPEQRGACAGSTFVCSGGTPGACSYVPQAETCNGIDDDCNGMVDDGLVETTYYRDQDGDGFGNPAMSQESCSDPGAGWVTNASDCDDTDSDAFPGQTDWFETPANGGGFDYDCSGMAEKRYGDASCRCNLPMGGVCQHFIGYFGGDGRTSCGSSVMLSSSCSTRSGSACSMLTSCSPNGSAATVECR